MSEIVIAAFIGTFVPLMILAVVLRHSRAVMLSFCWGMCAFLITYFLVPILNPVFGTERLEESAVFLGPPVEEFLKALPFLLFVGLAPRTLVPFFYILGMASGIGFAIEENLRNLLLFVDQSDLSIGIMVARSFSTCVMHGICTALIGLAFTTARRRKRQFCVLPLLAWGLASFLHGLFNYAALRDWTVAYLTVPLVIFVIGVVFLKRREKEAPETKGTDWE